MQCMFLPLFHLTQKLGSCWRQLYCSCCTFCDKSQCNSEWHITRLTDWLPCCPSVWLFAVSTVYRLLAGWPLIWITNGMRTSVSLAYNYHVRYKAMKIYTQGSYAVREINCRMSTALHRNTISRQASSSSSSIATPSSVSGLLGH